MRVLHVAETVGGGIATYLNTLLPWQIEKYGHARVGLVFPLSDLDTLSAEVKAGAVLFGYSRSGRNLTSLIKLHLALSSAANRFQPDLVHAHSSFAGFIARLRRYAAVVYSPHGWAFSRSGSALKNLLFTLIERVLSTRTALIIAVSADEQRLAASAGIAMDKVIKVLSGLPDQADAPRQVPPGELGPLKLIFVGRFDRQKGLDWLLDALQPLLPDQAHLTAVGAPWVDNRVAPPQTAGVSYPGWVPYDQMNAYLDAADALVVPSRWEAFGLVALEAMRRGLAVIASRKGALPELVVDGVSGLLFDLEDPEAFRTLLLRQTQADLAVLGAGGRERFLSHFTAERMCLGVDSGYRSIPGIGAE